MVRKLVVTSAGRLAFLDQIRAQQIVKRGQGLVLGAAPNAPDYTHVKFLPDDRSDLQGFARGSRQSIDPSLNELAQRERQLKR